MEILNLEHNYKHLIIKALNKTNTTFDAAVALGCSLRQLFYWMKEYNIVYNKENKTYGEIIQRIGIAEEV